MSPGKDREVKAGSRAQRGRSNAERLEDANANRTIESDGRMDFQPACGPLALRNGSGASARSPVRRRCFRVLRVDPSPEQPSGEALPTDAVLVCQVSSSNACELRHYRTASRMSPRERVPKDVHALLDARDALSAIRARHLARSLGPLLFPQLIRGQAEMWSVADAMVHYRCDLHDRARTRRRPSLDRRGSRSARRAVLRAGS